MDVSVADGKPVASLAPPPAERRTVRFGTMRDTIELYPGWDDPITEEELFGERLRILV